MTTEPANYKDTLNLPKTAFDMKANLVQREPAMLKGWEDGDLYGKIRSARKGAKKWVLHDGPPYANGDIHMGHLINKTIKDIVVKFRTMQGLDSPYVPGWDCHGLPIESAIQKELDRGSGPKFRELPKSELRQKCHDYAMKYVKLQGDSFKRLGIFGSFDNPYLTLNPKYEGGILDVLAELVQRDLVYRQKKPVHWCTNDRTALAEAELEYADRKDHSIYVNFQLSNALEAWPAGWGKVPSNAGHTSPFLMIWTTTPWTLPANRAVAVHPKHNYVVITTAVGDRDGPTVIVAEQLADKMLAVGGINRASRSAAITGAELVASGLKYRHPLDPTRLQPILLADYVTLEDGTGLVHTAPGHGAEDYQTGKRNNLEIYNPVLPDGKYDDTVPDFLRGTSIWNANQMVIDRLRELGTLFHHAEFNHSYPHCWRCKKPVIFRATEQWFVRASNQSEQPPSDSQSSEPRPLGSGPAEAPAEVRPPAPSSLDRSAAPSLWTNAKSFVNQVQWIPEWGKNRIDGMLDTRPDWCISRQRSWGVPIPAFFDAKGNTILTEKTVRRLADHFRQFGADTWYTQTPAELLGLTDPATQAQGLQSLGLSADLDLAALDKGQDILDVWFESGASHHAVLEGTHPDLGYPAQMYLEGSDQHRGWFQSSLLEASGYKSQPPFKQVLTHGFVVDGQGKKMSKSEGNDIKVTDALKLYGADVLRLWVCSVDYQNDIPCSKDLFARTGEAYRKIRNTIRYLLGNLYDFDPSKDTTEPAAYSIDRWMQHRLDLMKAQVAEAYDTYQFHNVFKTIYEFCNVEISAIYAKAIKDRLYCELPANARRRASQTVCYRALLALIELTAPVLVYTADEAWSALRQLPGCAALEESIHLHVFNSEFRIQNSEFVTSHWSILMPLIESGNKQLDDLKRTIGLGNALDAEAVIVLPKVHDEVSARIAEYGPEIEDALGVGFHRIEHGETWAIKINDTREKYPSCARSWKRRPDVGSVAGFPDLSQRDAQVVRSLRG